MARVREGVIYFTVFSIWDGILNDLCHFRVRLIYIRNKCKSLEAWTSPRPIGNIKMLQSFIIISVFKDPRLGIFHTEKIPRITALEARVCQRVEIKFSITIWSIFPIIKPKHFRPCNILKECTLQIIVFNTSREDRFMKTGKKKSVKVKVNSNHYAFVYFLEKEE